MGGLAVAKQHYPPGHSLIFNPTVTFSPLVEYEFKSANLGVTEWVTLFEAILQSGPEPPIAEIEPSNLSRM